MPRLLALVALLFALPAHAEVNIDWVTVGDPGNAADGTTYGAVSYSYRIGKYEVTNAQYAEFLNAVAATDTNALYNTGMGDPSSPNFGGITRSGSSGSFSYSAIAGREDKPVNFVSFWDAARFANWLHNGQPTGGQDNTTTEAGAYTLTPDGIAANSVTRNGGATVFVPSEDEWYKAAYYKGGGISAGYWAYPAGSDTQTGCTAPEAAANTANCDFAVGDLTDRGSYTGAASPSGTFDQGGNIWEWNETIMSGSSYRGQRGGAYPFWSNWFAASEGGGFWPTFEMDVFGFRVARSAPFPQGIPALSPLGLLIAAASLLGISAYLRRRA